MRFGFWSIGLVLAGCSGESETPATTSDTGTAPPSACEAASPSVAIGTGEFSFAPLSEGDSVEMVLGPQDGWHVLTGAEVVGLGPVVSFIGSLHTADGRLVASADDPMVAMDLAQPGLASWDAATCTGSFFGQFTYVDDVDPGQSTLVAAICRLHNTDMVFGIDIEDDAGTVFHDEVAVRAMLDPDTRCP